ncbi:MAG TPA: S-layer homology domain-containing protein [Bacillus sp. (in: firmicutes)]|nr:S-layer homology domain-containing protein [Bacillus sp. (in: firmicutes)]
MTNQYRKFLAGSVSAAIAASAIVPGASAASFRDVAANSTHADAIHALTAEGVLKGFENGTFGVDKPVTRGQVAKIFARLLEGNQPDNLAAFSDIPVDHVDQELVKAAAKVKAIGAFTGSSGNLMPSNHLTRQQMAKVLVEAFNLQHHDSYTNDLKDIHTAYAEFQDYIAILAENGITQVADGKFRPLEIVTRAQFATFVQRARQAANQVVEQTELAVQDVQILSGGGRHLEVTFNKPVSELTNTQFRVIKNDSQAVMGTEEVRLNKDGTSAVIILYKGNTLETGESYTLSFEHRGNVQQIPFEDYQYNEDGYVTSAKKTTREIELSGVGTLSVPEDVEVDFQQLVGQRIRAWYDSDENLRRFALTDDQVFYDGIEVASKIKLLATGKKYKVTADTKLYVNGKAAQFSAYSGKELPYAKVALNEDGDTGLVYAYTWDEEPILVKKVDGTVVYDLDGDKLDLEKYIILKDGKPMNISDLHAGDMLYFNEDAKNSNGKSGIAEVYNNTVAGKLTQVFDGDKFEVNDKTYDCIGDVFSARIVDGDEYKDFREDEAEQLEGKTVTLHFSRNGDLVLVERGNKTKPIDTTKPAFTSSNITSIGVPDHVLSAAETLTLNFSEALTSAAVETIKTKLTAAFNKGVTVTTDDYKTFVVKVNEDVAFSAGTVKVTFNESEIKDHTENGNEAFEIIIQD